MEVWREIEGTNGRYEVSNAGKIRSTNYKNSRKTVELKPAKDAKGYLRTVIIRNGKPQTIRVHREIAKVFIPNPDNLPQVNHINGIKTDNRVENLEWADNYTNAHHALDNGLFDNSLKAIEEANNRRKTPIVAINIETGERIEFESYMDARRYTGCSHIHSVLNGKQESAKGYKFERIERG